MDDVLSFEGLWECSLGFHSHCWHNEEEARGGSAHEGANCCALQKLGKNFWKKWHNVFSNLFLFFFNNNLQKTAVLYCKQCTGKGLKQLRSIHSEVLLKRLAKLLLDSGGTDLSKSFFWLGVKFSRCRGLYPCTFHHDLHRTDQHSCQHGSETVHFPPAILSWACSIRVPPKM